MTTWIFQGVLEDFDINAYLLRQNYIYWSVKIEAHQKYIAAGDHAFIWRAKGKSKSREYGIVAYGKVTETCKPKALVSRKDALGDDLWLTPEPESSSTKAGIDLEGIRLKTSDRMLTADKLSTDEILSQMTILTSKTGTTFRVSEIQEERLLALWNETAIPEEGQSEMQTPEGAVNYRLHRFRERSTALIEAAKDCFKQKHGEVFCEVCSFSFEKFYGPRGRDFIEVHHVKPISLMKPGEQTSLSDLMLLCANCHRMAHRTGPVLDRRQLLSMVKQTRDIS